MKNLFDKYQKDLIKMANSYYGRMYLNISDVPRDKKIVKLLPNGYIFNEKGNLFKGIFYCSDWIAKSLCFTLTDLEIIDEYEEYRNLNKYKGLLHYAGLTRNNDFPQIMKFTNTFTPSAGDGYAARFNFVEAWSTTISSTGNDSNYTNTNDTAVTAIFSGGKYQCNRGFFPVDTSALGITSLVSSAVLSLYITANNDSDSSTLLLVDQNSASTSTLSNSDYETVSYNMTPYGSLTKSSISLNSYNDITITNTKKINLTGFTKIAVVSGLDNTAVAPTGNNSTQCNFSESPTNKPKYTITYQPLSAGFLFNLI